MNDPLPLVDRIQVPALFSRMIDQIPGFLWSTDRDLRLMAAFGAGLATLDVHPRQFLGKTLYEYFESEEDALPIVALHRRALAGETVDVDGVFLNRAFRVHVRAWRDEQDNVIGCVGFALDITEHKRAEDELRHSEARWRSVLANAPVQVSIVDRAGTILCINRPVPGMSLDAVLGKSVYDFLQPEYHEQASDCVEQVFRNGGTVVNESVGIGPHGTQSWYETRMGPVEFNGQVVAVALVSTDITERKRAEMRLMESERKLYTLMSNLPGMAYRCRNDSHWTMEYVSDGCYELTGYQAWELIGNRTVAFGDTIHPADRQAVWEGVQQALSEPRSFQLQYRIHTVQGDVRWVLEQGTGVFSSAGEVLALEGFITDITARRSAEKALEQANAQLEHRVQERTAALRQSEAKYRALVESSPDAVVMVDLRGQIVFASQRTAEQHGLRHPEEMVGRFAGELVSEADRERFKTSLASLIEDGVHRNLEYRFLRADGSTFDAEVSSVLLLDEAGAPEAALGVYRNVTERKQTQEKLRIERQALRRMVLAGDHERRLVTYELHDGVAQQLLGAMLHLQALEPRTGRTPEEIDATCREGLDVLRQASQELRRVMNRLRTPVLDRFGLAEAIDDVIAQSRSTADGPDIQYRHDVQFRRLEPTLENSLFRIAQEAIANACRHSQSEKIRVVLTQQGDEVTLEVRDWGTGFDSTAVAENRFGVEGIRERSRLLGGRLSLRTAPGQGTTIRVTFPVIEADEE